jgi:hypothetical protein
MPQKKKAVKKDVKKDIKKVVKNVIKNSKQQPLLKNSINIKIDLDDDNEKKKKPKRKKRQPKQADETANKNNVSYVDESGIPISNEIINNRSFNRSYMPQPFSRNSTVIGTSFNESAIMDRVIEKMSKLNNSNQSMNNTALNQSTTVPAPPQLPRPARAFPPPSTIAPASPSVAPQSLNFNLSSPVRPVGLGLMPLLASSLAFNRVQQLGMDSGKAAETLQEAIAKLFLGVEDMEQAEIKRATDYVRIDKYSELMKVPVGGARKGRFKTLFKETYTGTMYPEDAAGLGYGYYKLVYGV